MRPTDDARCHTYCVRGESHARHAAVQCPLFTLLSLSKLRSLHFSPPPSHPDSPSTTLPPLTQRHGPHKLSSLQLSNTHTHTREHSKRHDSESTEAPLSSGARNSNARVERGRERCERRSLLAISLNLTLRPRPLARVTRHASEVARGGAPRHFREVGRTKPTEFRVASKRRRRSCRRGSQRRMLDPRECALRCQRRPTYRRWLLPRRRPPPRSMFGAVKGSVS